MLSFFKRGKSISPNLPVLIDMHSHLIPGIDDGVKTVEESITLIKRMVKLGYKKIITTPHVYHELYPNNTFTILQGLEAVKLALTKQKVPVDFCAAAEYFMDEHFEELLRRKELLTIKDDFVLVEMSFIAPPPKLEHYIFNLCTKGYQPILAHPERYSFLGSVLSKYERLKDLGCYFQVNLLSLQGHYGSTIQKTAERLLRAGMVDFLGTDLHNEGHINSIEDFLYSRTMKKISEKYTFKNELL